LLESSHAWLGASTSSIAGESRFRFSPLRLDTFQEIIVLSTRTYVETSTLGNAHTAAQRLVYFYAQGSVFSRQLHLLSSIDVKRTKIKITKIKLTLQLFKYFRWKMDFDEKYLENDNRNYW
jgi:hypothetical protein